MQGSSISEAFASESKITESWTKDKSSESLSPSSSDSGTLKGKINEITQKIQERNEKKK